MDAWLVRPAGFEPGKRYPVLLSVHGGPFTQYGTGFFDEFQVYAGAGYAVLFSNPRGGSGYSEAWGRAIRGPIDGAGPGWGTVDFEDVHGRRRHRAGDVRLPRRRSGSGSSAARTAAS